MSMSKIAAKQLVVCIENDGYPASLERRKIYVALRDEAAGKHGLLRVIDESDDYLYPKSFFLAGRPPPNREARRTCRRIASHASARAVRLVYLQYESAPWMHDGDNARVD